MSLYTIEISESQRCQVFFALSKLGESSVIPSEPFPADISDLMVTLSDLYRLGVRTHILNITVVQWELLVCAVGAVHLILEDEDLLPMLRDIPRVQIQEGDPNMIHGLCW